MIDFSKYERTNTYYGGTERKFGVNVDGFEYMIKFQKQTNFGVKRLNHISEYVGSHIFELLGFETQDTYLGLYNDEQVVACKNFINGETQFVPFNKILLTAKRNLYPLTILAKVRLNKTRKPINIPIKI